jgi:membrane-bound lytic murein transglycosylase B
VEKIFSSKQALHKETKALNIISNIKNIKKHRKSEQKANKKMLLKKALLKKHLKKYQSTYDKVEKKFGVNREVVAAILQKETALGAFKAYKHNALSVFISLLKGLQPHKYSGRQKVRLQRFVRFAHNNLVALISFYELQGKDVLKADLRSSYAGAIGIPQFSPMHFDMIISPNGDAAYNLHDMPTAIYSTANLLKNRFQWDAKLKYYRLKGLKDVIEQWREFDDGTKNFVYKKNLDGIKVDTFAANYKDDKKVQYVGNYVRVLKRYNFSTAYALGILQIAKAVREQ